jgi:hypothetical protein
LFASLPDVSKATVYRQVSILVKGGLLDVVGQRRVRGAVERSYRLHDARLTIDREAAEAMSIADHRQGFAAAITALIADFNTYLDREGADPVADSVSYAQAPVWLTDRELGRLISEIRRIITANTDNMPRPDRRLYVFSPILFPIDQAPTLDDPP